MTQAQATQPANTMNQVAVLVTGDNVQTSESFQTAAEEKVAALSHFFDQIHDAQVTCSQVRHEQIVEITLHASGVYLRGEGSGTDWYAALDMATDKLRRQLKKYKGRLSARTGKEHHNLGALPTLAVSQSELDVEDYEQALETPAEWEDYVPKVIHKEVKTIPVLTVDEAVMQMDLLHYNVLLFQNPKTGQLNSVFRQHEGAPVVWLEVQKDAKLES